MYKRASRNLQHAHRVDQIDPSKGITTGYTPGVTEDDLIPSANNMGIAECRAELAQLAVEIVRAQQALAVAKRMDDKEQIKFLGLKLAGLSTRRAPLKRRIHDLEQAAISERLGDAVKLFCDPETRDRIFAYANGMTILNQIKAEKAG
jgi:hypothetical protein